MRTVTTTLILALAIAVPSLTSCQPARPSAGSGGSRGALLWARTYTGPRPHGNAPVAVAVSPTGSAVFVTGYSDGANGVKDYATVAYSAKTGGQLWVSRYNGPGNAADLAYSMVVSQSGRMVFVTGSTVGGQATSSDYATIAYNAKTGARVWVSRYNGPASRHDDGHSVAVGPRGHLVFVTGQSAGTTAVGGNSEDFLTIAYRADTGAKVWVRRYNGPGNGLDDASSVLVSPDGGTVFVTGTSYDVDDDDPSIATVAYRAATGARLWISRYRPGSLDRLPSLTVSPSGKAVYVIGATKKALIAYNTATGARLWATGIGGQNGSMNSVAVSPAGTMVYVTGCTLGGQATGVEYMTEAYHAATGARAWVSHYANVRVKYACANAVAVSRSGATAYVVGVSGQSSLGTVAYSAKSGRQIWTRRYRKFGKDFVSALAVAVSPTSGSVFVTGTDSKRAYVTLAYSG
jgi:PQQ-like domain